MGELLLIVLAAALVNNFVLVQFLGLCPALGASRRLEGAIGMALATGLVLTTASGLSFLVDRFLLQRFELQYLKLLSFVVVIGVSLQLAEISIRRFAPLLSRLLGIYVPVLASNCAVLGVALLNSAASRSFVAARESCRSPSSASRASPGSDHAVRGRHARRSGPRADPSAGAAPWLTTSSSAT
jgi:electron transport complex protein RnfA